MSSVYETPRTGRFAHRNEQRVERAPQRTGGAIHATISDIQQEARTILKTLEGASPKTEGDTAILNTLIDDPLANETIERADGRALDEMSRAITSETQRILKTLDSQTQRLTALETVERSSETETGAKRLLNILDGLLKQEVRDSAQFYPRNGFPADGGAIEGQWVEAIRIDSTVKPSLVVNFKLTERHLHNLVERLEAGELSRDIATRDDVISFQAKDRTPIPFSDATLFERGGVCIRLAKGVLTNDLSGDSTLTKKRSALGLVSVDLPGQDLQKETGELAVLMEDLGISSCFNEPTQEDENSYKLARYAWHHKEETVSEARKLAVTEGYKLEEVMAGYSTYIDPGINLEYRKIAGDFAFYHEYAGPVAHLADIFETEGLLCTRKRYEGGKVDCNGMSSSQDLVSGGADSVFTRLVTEKGLDVNPGANATFGLPQILFRPNIADRTDWYAYDEDAYGTTDPATFQTRQSPRDLFENHAKGIFSYNNEEMFRHGLPKTDSAGIMVSGFNREKLNALMVLATRGMDEIGGKNFDTLLLMDRDSVVAHYKSCRSQLKLSDEEIETEIPEDDRDRILRSFKAKGVKEIQGVPIETFVRYGEVLSDAIEAVAGTEFLDSRCIKEWKQLLYQEIELQKS